MNKQRLKSGLCLVLWGLLLTFAVYTQIQSSLTTLKISFARDQTEIFERMREKVKRGNAAEAADALGYVVSYYPSGTKQSTGSGLDLVVEQARRSAVREIIAELRAKTGRDFGDDPMRWIDGLKAAKGR